MDYESVTTLLSRVALRRRQAARHPRPAERLPGRRSGELAQALGAPVRGAALGSEDFGGHRGRGETAVSSPPARGSLRHGRPRRGCRQAREQPLHGPAAARPDIPTDRGLAQRPSRARARGLRPGRPQQDGAGRGSRSSSPTPTSRWPTSAAPARRRNRYWNTRLLDSTSRTSAHARPTRAPALAWPETADESIPRRRSPGSTWSCSPTSTRSTVGRPPLDPERGPPSSAA